MMVSGPHPLGGANYLQQITRVCSGSQLYIQANTHHSSWLIEIKKGYDQSLASLHTTEATGAKYHL